MIKKPDKKMLTECEIQQRNNEVEKCTQSVCVECVAKLLLLYLFNVYGSVEFSLQTNDTAAQTYKMKKLC